jgi:hypothetical protein
MMGHQVESLLFWNGPQGLSFDRVTSLPAMGPHLASPRDFGNAYTREPLENYVSPAYDAQGRRPVSLSWIAQTPPKTQMKFQLRHAESEDRLGSAGWEGSRGEDSFYERSGAIVRKPAAAAQWLQYKATFVSLDGSRSPKLEEVRIDFE